MNDILASLNAEQKLAATHLDGPLLILAGAGSGKTKTITTRLAYLIDIVGIAPSSTLTLTFTNKAASQMRYRALQMIRRNDLIPPLLCTFHKFGLLFLKLHISYLGRKANFVLIDSDDKNKIIKNFNSPLSTKLLSSEISKMKNWTISPSQAKQKVKDGIYKEEIVLIYERYEQYLIEKNMLDFDDLLLLSYKILEENPALRDEISRKYNYIMVDEYQDTNKLQYKLLKQMCSAHENLCVVGDDDQSIYGWRGANIDNILEFGKQFKNAKIIRLEQNYRSTNEILEVANKLIGFNTKRLGKELRSTKGSGKDVELLESLDERIEAQSIARKIRTLLDSGVSPNNIAILFRLNALSRGIEDGLNSLSIPYRLIGTLRFYERSEIKDILSYLRLIVNPHDDFSLLRVINRPKRGIGKTTQDKLEQYAQRNQISIYQAICERAEHLDFAKKHIGKIKELFDLLQYLRDVLKDSTIAFLDNFKEKINILDTYKNDKDEVDREANIDEFYGYFRDFIIENPTADLEDYLNDISLFSDSDEVYDEAVSCMSVHSSKGLEFDYIFVIGLEEGFFPIISDNTCLEEERRLGYVAFTRAKNELVLSCVQSRYYKGKRAKLQKSRFLCECGLVAGRIHLDKAITFRKNDLVFHKIFGAGRVVGVEHERGECKLTINFGGLEKKVISSFVTKA